MILNCDFNHESPWILILYHAYMKLLLLSNPHVLMLLVTELNYDLSVIDVEIMLLLQVLYYSYA